MRASFSEHFAVPSPEEELQSSSDTNEGQVKLFKTLLLDEVDLKELGGLGLTERRIRLERILAHLISREGLILSTRERSALIRTVVDEAVGLGSLEPLLADPSISEIMINGHREIWVERRGQLERVPSAFTSDAQLIQTIDRIVSTVNRRVDEASPMVDARLPADARLPRGARVNVVLPPLTLDGPHVTIRLFPRAFGIGELLQRGMLDEATAQLLAACVRARLNIIVSGGTSSGKTTFLNALSAFIPDRERIITVEDAAELSLTQPHVVRMETRPPNIDGYGQVTIRHLVRNSLRMRPDRIIVGEVRGGEALDMLQAMNTGHEGSLTTVHANTAEDATSRLETLATMSEVQVPFAALREQVNSAVDLVIQVQRASDGTRRVTEVAHLASRRREDYRLRPLLTWERGSFVTHPVSEALAARLVAHKETVPEGFEVGG